MLVQTRAIFEQALTVINNSSTLVVDIETNGLQMYNDNVITGIAIYSPSLDASYYFPWRHGVGKININYTEANDATKAFTEMSWTGKTKKDTYLSYWWAKLQPSYDFNNLPSEWEAELQAILLKRHCIFHNAMFDLGGLAMAGYGTPPSMVDTMVGLHVVHEDWGGIQIEAPYKWSDKDYNANHCKKTDVGLWAADKEGKLLRKKVWGNKELKFWGAYLELEGATEGEAGLKVAIKEVKEDIVQFILENITDPYNEDLLYADIRKGKKGAWEKWGEAQKDEIASKINLNEKEQMWMLPASKVSAYAETDVRLTWGLKLWIDEQLENWDNQPLWKTLNETLLKVTFPINFRGMKLDVKAAREQEKELAGKAEVLEGLMKNVVGDPNFNPGSPKMLLAALNSGILTSIKDTPIPDWWDAETRAVLGTYEQGHDVDTDEKGNEVIRWKTLLHSTAKESLERFDHHPFVKMVQEWRKAAKGGATYLKNWIENRDGKGYLHPQFNITGTLANRLSSSGSFGNAQNIPERNGYRVKEAIVVPSDEYVIVAIDYGQLELRLASWIAETKLKSKLNMTLLFEDNVDMHAYTRDKVNIRQVLFGNMNDAQIGAKLGYDLSKLSPEELSLKIDGKDGVCRYVAKTMNFGLCYGGGKRMLSKLLRLDLDTADELVQAWRKLYPAFMSAATYYYDLALRMRPCPSGEFRTMWVEQPFSRRMRKIGQYRDHVVTVDKGTGVKQHWNEKEAEARKVWNNVCQGTGGYIANTSALTIANNLPDNWTFGIIHDAIEMYVRKDQLDTLPYILDTMVDWDVRPKLTVDVSASQTNWQDMRKVSDLQRFIDSEGKEGYKG